MSGVSIVTGGMISPTISGTGDWTVSEKEQIRSALGVNGTKTSVIDSEIIDGMPSVDGIVDGVWEKDLTEYNTVNTAGKIVKQIKSVVSAILGLIS